MHMAGTEIVPLSTQRRGDPGVVHPLSEFIQQATQKRGDGEETSPVPPRECM